MGADHAEGGGSYRKKRKVPEIELAEDGRRSLGEHRSYVSPISLLDEYEQQIEVRNDRVMAEQIQNHAFRELVVPMKSLKQQQQRDPQFLKLRKK